MADAAELAYLAYLTEEEKTRQRNVLEARNYFEGNQHTELTERQKEYLGFKQGGRFVVNYCRTVVQAVSERMIVAGFSSRDERLSKWAWEQWQANRMDAAQMTVHESAIKDGEFFVFVTWNEEEKRVEFIPHPRYTDPLINGTGFGCKAHYDQGDTTTPMLYATKRWTETATDERGKRQTQQRMTVYYPDRIEKYAATGSGKTVWEQIEKPIPWVNGRGEPLGIPIVPFFNPGELTELWDAMPVQDAINKTVLDLLATADAAGFPLRFTPGFYFTTDGKAPASDASNYVSLTPGACIFVPEGKEVQELPGSDLRPLLETFDNLVLKLAQVTDTPLSRFQVTRQIAAEGTLKQQEGPLLAKIRARSTVFGNAWEDCIKLAMRFANAWGSEGLNEDQKVETVWEPAETRDEKEQIETIGLKVEKLRIPLEQAWREAGYSQEEIETMLESDEYQARLAMQQAAKAAFGPGGSETEGE